MKLTLDNLKNAGAFTGAPVLRQITWRQGEEQLTADVYVRPQSYRSAVSDLLARGAGQDPIAGRIAAHICDEEGKPVFTVADITGDADAERGSLDGNLTVALLAVIGEVTGLGKTTS